MKHPEMIKVFRRGLTLMESNDTESVCRRGLIRVFEYKDNLSDEQPTEKRQSTKNLFLQQIMVNPVVNKNEDDCKIDIYKTMKVVGHNCQISYIESMDGWIIGTNHNACVIKEKKDLNFINCQK